MRARIRRHRVKLTAIRWTPPELISQAIEHAPAHVKPLIAFLVGTGARLREAALLDWGEVDLPGKTVTFMDAKNGETAAVPLPGFVIEALSALPHRDGAVFRRDDGQPYAEYVRVRVEGLPRTAGGLKMKALRRTLAAIGLTPHGTRHAFVSYIAARDGLAAAGALARHKSVAMTKRYTHFAPSRLRDAVDNLPIGKKSVNSEREDQEES